MKKNIYLTYAEGLSGVYQSQVLDVVYFLKHDMKADIRLVALVSIRNFREMKKQIKQTLPDAKVIPMVPKLRNMMKNRVLLKLLWTILKPDQIIARGPLATYLAQKSSEKRDVKIIYDGRGANKEEEREYSISAGALTYADIEKYESSAVLNSDFRIAVSQKLVEYWKREFLYESQDHSVIPCMLGSNFENKTLDLTKINIKRTELGYTDSDIILIYSGSIAAWQSFDFLFDFLNTNLSQNPNLKLMFLSQEHSVISRLSEQFPTQVKRFWLHTSEVFEYLSVGDYGILFREQTVTNEVASPVKFAEYLSAGLKVLISANLGDFSGFVRKFECGAVIDNLNIDICLNSFEIKKGNSALGRMNFSKKAEFYQFLNF